MIFMAYVATGVVLAVASLYFAWRSRDFRKFLAGAFFVNSRILFYLYLADVSVPILGTNVVETPEAAVTAPSSTSSCFCYVSISGSSRRRLQTQEASQSLRRATCSTNGPSNTPVSVAGGSRRSSAASLEAHQREPDNTGHQEPSDVPPTRGDGIADGGVPINDDRHCNDP